jgi:hypothetical protein
VDRFARLSPVLIWPDEPVTLGHWRTNAGANARDDEVDLVVEYDDGKVLAFEVKDAAHRPRVSSRSRARPRYVEPTQAAWELLEEAVEPWNADIERRGTLGFTESASVIMVGVITGLRRCEPAPESTVSGLVLSRPGNNSATRCNPTSAGTPSNERRSVRRR